MTVAIITGASPHITWDNMPWQKAQEHVHRLQMRIAKATREGRMGKVRALQRLLTHSFYAKCLAVRRVVQNKGARTPGVDKILWRTSKQRMAAVKALKRRGYHPLPRRRIYIFKKSGGKRPLSIPTTKDRAMEALWHLALVPVAEEWADPNSYGFRPKRSVADAIEQCFITLLGKWSATWIFEGDIRACFDQLSHEWLEKNIPMDKTILRKFLKAGFMEKGVLFPTLSGTAQGGICSTTLTVMALSGLERLLKARWPRHKVNTIFYADDFVVTGATREVLEQEVIPAIKAFLAERGLELSETKSKITHIDDGFDFLGFHIRKYKGRLLPKPSKASVKRFLKDIRALIKSLGMARTEELIAKLNPKILGWAQFFRHVSTSRTFAKVDKEIFDALQRWMRRKHPTKSKTWRNKRYFRSVGQRNWQFTVRFKKKGELFPQNLDLAWAKHLTFKKHIKIRGIATPFNPKFREYFEQRDKLKKGSPLTRMLEEFW